MNELGRLRQSLETFDLEGDNVGSPNRSDAPQVLKVRAGTFGGDLQLYMLSHSGQKAGKKNSTSVYEWHGTMHFLTSRMIDDEKEYQVKLFWQLLKQQLPHFGKDPYGVDIAFNWHALSGAILPNGESVQCLITLGYVSNVSFADYSGGDYESA